MLKRALGVLLLLVLLSASHASAQTFKTYDHQTQAQVTTALAAGGYSFISGHVVGPDSAYPNASATIVLLNSTKDGGTSYRVAFSSVAAAKTYVTNVATAYPSTFTIATLDDGKGYIYTYAQVANGWSTIVGYTTYTDSFTRANGSLGANWTFPSSAPDTTDPPVISNDLLVANGTLPGIHYFDIYTGGTFGNNQFSRTTIQSLTSNVQSGCGAADSVGLIVHGTVSNYYNDAVQNFPTTGCSNIGIHWALGIANGVDFAGGVPFSGSPTYAVGDTVELDAVGTNPIFFTHLHNGVVDGSGADSTYLLTGGVPGTGIAVNAASTAVVKAGAWTGGTLANVSANTSDNFTRANGWLGVDWWTLPPSNTGCGFQIVSNQAQDTCTSGNFGFAIRTLAFNLNQSSTVNPVSGTAVGAVVRTTPANETCYLVFWLGGTAYLYEYSNGAFNTLTTFATVSTLPSSIELDATGTSPVVLTVKVNGTTLGTFSDSTYLLTGTFPGFMGYDTSATVSGWSGANL